MKTPFVCAMILSQFAAQTLEAAPAAPGRTSCMRSALATARAVAPAPVAELTTGNGPAVEGALLRIATAPQPIQMLNPLAPPEYGSGRALVTFSDDDPYRNATHNPRRAHPDGIRLLTLRPLW